VHCLYVVLFLFLFLFLARCSPAPVLGVGPLLALGGKLPLLAAGPWEDPTLGDDLAELGEVHEAHHAAAGNEGEAIGVRPGPLESLNRDGPVARAEGRALRLFAMEQSPLAHPLAPSASELSICGG